MDEHLIASTSKELPDPSDVFIDVNFIGQCTYEAKHFRRDYYNEQWKFFVVQWVTETVRAIDLQVKLVCVY